MNTGNLLSPKEYKENKTTYFMHTNEVSWKIYEELQQYVISGKLNRKQSDKVRPLLVPLFGFFMDAQLPNRLLGDLALISRGKTSVLDEFRILSFYNDMEFRAIYQNFQITESDLHNLKDYYGMHYYKFPSKEFATLKDNPRYSFCGFARKRSIVVYNISLEALNTIPDLRFKVLSVNKSEINLVLGKAGKRTKFYPDRSVKFVMPKRLSTNNRIKINIYSNVPEIQKILDEIKGCKQLVPSNTWFKASTTKLKQCCLVTVSSKALRKILNSKSIQTIYCDVRDNYLIISPSSLRPSRNSYVAKIYPSGKISFTIPEYKPIKFVGLAGIKVNSLKGFFQTAEEEDVAQGLLNRGYNVLAISQHQQQDITLLKVAGNKIVEMAAMQIKNIKLNPPSLNHIFGDLYKCLRFSSRTSKRSFFLINSHWKRHPYLVSFEGEPTIDFSEKHNTHIIFTDYNGNWQGSVLDEIETHLS